MNENMRVAPEEKRLLESLRAQPALAARLERLVGLARVESLDTLGTADEIEEEIAGELRGLGADLVGGWARAAEVQVAAEVRRAHPGARLREKKG